MTPEPTATGTDCYEAAAAEVMESLAEKAAEAAEERDKYRSWLRDDPQFREAHWYESKARGELKALADAICRLRERYTDGDAVDVEEFAEYLYGEHIQTNEWRSEATGTAKEAAHGYHHGYHVALDVLKNASGIQYEDYGGELA